MDGALGFVHTNPDTFVTAYSFDINNRPSVHTKPVNPVTETAFQRRFNAPFTRIRIKKDMRFQKIFVDVIALGALV